jgi:hypothetical protein
VHTIEAYRRNKPKRDIIAKMLKEAEALNRRRLNILKQIEDTMGYSWKSIREGFPDNSFLTNKQVIFHKQNSKVNDDPVKAGILDIMRKWMPKFDFQDITKSIVTAIPSVCPYTFEDTMLIKISMAARAKSAQPELRFTFSNGRMLVAGKDMITEFTTEQATYETSRVIKSLTKELDSDIKRFSDMLFRFKKELEPYIVMDKI